MRDVTRMVAGMLLFTTACAAEMETRAPDIESSEDDVEVAPLYTLELAPRHTIEFIDLGRGSRIINEHGPKGTKLLTAVQTRSFVEVFRQVRPGAEVPAVLIEADAALKPEQWEPEEGVGLRTLAASTEEWKDLLGGCVCPLGDVVHQFCKEGRTGNWSDQHKAEYAWFNINHISGNGIDAFTRCDGKTVKRRYETGDVSRMTCAGPEDFLGFDTLDRTMRLQIKGADNGDIMDLSACWSIF